MTRVCYKPHSMQCGGVPKLFPFPSVEHPTTMIDIGRHHSFICLTVNRSFPIDDIVDFLVDIPVVHSQGFCRLGFLWWFIFIVFVVPYCPHVHGGSEDIQVTEVELVRPDSRILYSTLCLIPKGHLKGLSVLSCKVCVATFCSMTPIPLKHHM